MNGDLEGRLRTSLRMSANHIGTRPDLGDRMLQLGHDYRRRRRLTATLSAAVLVVVLASAAFFLVGGPPGSGLPAVTTPPSSSPPDSPSPTPAPSATSPGPGGFPREVSIVDTNGTIHAADGSVIKVPVPASTPVKRVTQVVGGWVVGVAESAAPVASTTTSFLTTDGILRSFGTQGRIGGQYAFSPDRTRMVALIERTLTVFELPSLRVVNTIDTTGQPFGQLNALWLRGDRIIAQYYGIGDGGGSTGVAVWNTSTGTRTDSFQAMVGDVSDDGTTVALQRGSGVGAASVGCLAIVAFTDQLVAQGPSFCDDKGRNLTPTEGSLSPDGQWIAVSSNALQVQTGGVRYSDVLVYRVSEVRAGTAQPMAYRDQFPEDGHAYHSSWATGNRVVIYEERLHWVLVCSPTTATCQELDRPASPRAVVG